MSTYFLTVPSRIGNAQFAYSPEAAAGAIHSLIWNGVDFVNRTDDGRLIQTALTTDDNEEDYNPTEGGALKDPAFYTPSDSLCIEHEQGPDWFRTLNRMALWKTGELSDFILSKRVTVRENTATFDLKLSTPATLVRTKQDKLEILTGYMPLAFGLFLSLDREEGAVHKISDGPGEQPLPVILAKLDGSAAMGVVNPAWGDSAPSGCGYGRWRFPDCVKWNCVQRYATPALGAVHAAQPMVAWGTLADAVNTLSTPRGAMAGQVRRLYHATLDRAPDDGGLTYCIGQLYAGMSLAELAAGFIASPEFQAKYGNTADTAFVTLLYRNVLGREPDADGLAFHVARLSAGVPRAQIVVGFSESPEFQIKRLLADAVQGAEQ